MSFTAIFIALLIERFFDCSHLRNWSWYTNYQQLVTQKLHGKSPYLILAAIVLPVGLGATLLVILISSAVFGFIKLAVSVLIMLYCFGPRNLWADTFNCLTTMAEGDAPATADKLKMAFGITNVADPQTMHRQWISNIFIQANRRTFAQVIWFGVLGIFGVILYRLLSLLVPDAGKETIEPQVAESARRAESYMDWVSIRVLTFVFALGGNFNRVMTCWRTRVAQGPDSNDAMLLECGLSAMNTTAQEIIPIDGAAEKEEISLLDRSLAIIVVIIAVLVFLIP